MSNNPPLDVTTSCRRGHLHSLHGRPRTDRAGYQCRLCHSASHKDWAKRNPKRRNAIAQKSYTLNKQEVKSRKLIAAFGITVEDYDRMHEAQGGLCAICQKSPVNRGLGVDHNHTTGQIRALLCWTCNFKLGALEDPLYPKLITYLEKYNAD